MYENKAQLYEGLGIKQYFNKSIGLEDYQGSTNCPALYIVRTLRATACMCTCRGRANILEA